MQVKSNKIKDIRNHYLSRLKKIYPEQEAKKLLEIIFEDLLGISSAEMFTSPEMRISESEMLTIHFAVRDLLKNRPVQHITGKTVFYGLKITVNESVLIPRPETEELVAWILSEAYQKPGLRVLDIGTGSGAIALALKNERPGWDVWALDNSEKALETARKNARVNNLRIHFLQTDILDEISRKNLSAFDIIVSNPPYVTESDKAEMQPNVLEFEPAEALYVPDEDPLKYYREISGFAPRNLRKHGEIFFEINEKFGREMIQLLEDSGFINIRLRKDLRNRHRMIMGTNNS